MRLMVAPASARDLKRAEEDGTLKVLQDAGAEFLGLGCGICAGYGGNVLGENVVAISTTARNFKGRMGAASSQVQLLLGTGLCGALTTYSTFSYETLRLAEDGARFFAAVNAAASLVAGLGAAFAGAALAGALWAG